MSAAAPNTNAEEGKKPGDQTMYINLMVKAQNGHEVYFRMRRTTQLRKLMKAYCDRKSLDMNSVAFLLDGRVLHAEQTPEELAMMECDEIDAMVHQIGGVLLI